MSNSELKVAVCSRSFSRNQVLREELVREYPNAKFNETGRSLSGAELVEFVRGHERAIIALEKVDANLLRQLPELKVISKYGVGLDGLDLAAMREFNVLLGWTPGVNRRSVSEMALALMIMMLRRLPQSNAEVRKGVWQQHVGNYLTGKTVGIVGLGRIGRDLVALLKPFAYKIIYHDLTEYSEFAKANGLVKAPLDTVMGADIVTLHVPLDSSTRGMIGAAALGKMKPGALLVNCARGGIVDEAALKVQLVEKRIFAAFDVFDVEPPTDLELLNLENFYATSHLGGSAEEAILAMGRAAIAGLGKFREAALENFAGVAP